jgi:hypothetical protein
MNLTIKFKKEKETKGAVRYKEVLSDGSFPSIQEGVIGNLYIRKDKIEGAIPETLIVTVEG